MARTPLAPFPGRKLNRSPHTGDRARTMCGVCNAAGRKVCIEAGPVSLEHFEQALRLVVGSSMEFEGREGTSLLWGSREYGDRETDTASAFDLATARTARERILEWAARNEVEVVVQVDTCDEWVNLCAALVR